MPNPLRTYRDFWPHYVREHRHPHTRLLHFVGTTGALLCGVAALILMNPWLVPAGFAFGYALAWAGHFFIERNRPATFRHVLWSFGADFHMYGLMWAGRMTAEVARLTRSTANGELTRIAARQ